MTSKDLEDAIQAASAVRAHADILVTRNVPDFAAMGVKAMTPDEFLAVVKP